jgi:hypothetical protein
MSNKGTSTTELIQCAIANESMAFVKRIQQLEGDELFMFARCLAEVKIPKGVFGTPVEDVFNTAQNMRALDDVQHMIHSCNEGS